VLKDGIAVNRPDYIHSEGQNKAMRRSQEELATDQPDHLHSEVKRRP
jgi:hypothetical protein